MGVWGVSGYVRGWCGAAGMVAADKDVTVIEVISADKGCGWVLLGDDLEWLVASGR